MYALLYRKLPGGTVAKIFQLLILLGLGLAFLAFVVFPYLDAVLPQEPAVNG